MSETIIFVFISQNTLADLQGPIGNIICTMGDVRRDILGPPVVFVV